MPRPRSTPALRISPPRLPHLIAALSARLGTIHAPQHPHPPLPFHSNPSHNLPNPATPAVPGGGDVVVPNPCFTAESRSGRTDRGIRASPIRPGHDAAGAAEEAPAPSRPDPSLVAFLGILPFLLFIVPPHPAPAPPGARGGGGLYVPVLPCPPRQVGVPHGRCTGPGPAPAPDLLLPRPNATATPFNATAAVTFAAARPHLAHLHSPAPDPNPAAASTASRALICPSSISMLREQLPFDGVRVVELPCELAVGSHVTVVARPLPEHDPKIAERRNGEAPRTGRAGGHKAVNGEAPPRILHFNPRIRGDYSRNPVIEMNSCYRMQWGQSQRCEGFASLPAEDTGYGYRVPD